MLCEQQLMWDRSSSGLLGGLTTACYCGAPHRESPVNCSWNWNPCCCAVHVSRCAKSAPGPTVGPIQKQRYPCTNKYHARARRFVREPPLKTKARATAAKAMLLTYSPRPHALAEGCAGKAPAVFGLEALLRGPRYGAHVRVVVLSC